MAFENLTLREKVCQIMCPTVDHFLRHGNDSNKYPVGFIFVDGRDFHTSEEEPVKKIDKIRNVFAGKIPLSIVSDGIVGFAGVEEVPTQFQIGTANDEELAYNHGKAVAMHQIYNGVDYLLGPACDIVTNPLSHMNADAYGGKPELNARMSVNFLKGVQSMGVAATVKHFPGMGSSPTNFHLAKARNLLSKEEWDESFGYVYKEAIDNDVWSVMTSHISLPAYSSKDETGKYPPATLSSELTQNLLKEKLGFKGVVISDALNMGGISNGDVVKTNVECFKAGTDVLLFSSLDAVDAIVEAIANGEIPMSRLDDALNRIYALKKKTGLLDKNKITPKLDAELVKKVNEEAMKKSVILKCDEKAVFPIDKNKVKNICLVGVSCKEGDAKCDFTYMTKALEKEGFNVQFCENTPYCWQHLIDEFQNKYDMIIFCFAGHNSLPIIPGKCFGELWTIKKIKPEKRMVIQFGMPYMYELYFQDEPIYIQMGKSEMDNKIIDNLMDILMGRKKATGEFSIPVKTDEDY